MNLEFGTMWAQAVNDLRNDGVRLDSRVGMTREIIAWEGKIHDPRCNVLLSPTRRMSPAYACGEMLWYLSGDRDAKRVLIQAPSYTRFLDQDLDSDDKEKLIAFGAYGERWERHEQLVLLSNLLLAQPNTRQAVITCWEAPDLHEALRGSKKDLPCTLSIQFLLRRGALHCIVTMRSNDVWLGMPYDVFCFTTLQQIVADDIGVKLGSYTHRVGSLHIYERDLEKLGTDEVVTRPNVIHNYSDTHPEAPADAFNGQLDDTYEPPGLQGTLYGDLMYTARTKTRPKAIESVVNPNLLQALELYNDRNRGTRPCRQDRSST